MTPARIILLFVKPPIPGRVKTRLAKDIGDQAACDTYRSFVSHTITEAVAGAIPLVVCHDGKQDELPEIWRTPAWRCMPQVEADLGKRMAEAFRTLFADGAAQVVLMGSDIPDLDATYLRAAFDRLGTHNLVIGPAMDGGYCLVGFNKEHFTPALFEDIPWSTDRVLELTLRNAATAGLSTALLAPRRDIDTWEDLRKRFP